MAQLTPAYRAVMAVSTPIVAWWGRMEVTGLDAVPADGPLLIAGNHDSYWDPIAVGLAARPVRQIHALAKSSLWKIKPVGWVLDGMGQIPIDRGRGDVGAMDRATEGLRSGICIGIFPEGTRSRGGVLRPRSGIGRLAEAVPEAQVVCVSVTGTVDVPRFPRRPRVRVRFFTPEGGGLQPGESHADFAARLVAQTRADAPPVAAGRKRSAAPS